MTTTTVKLSKEQIYDDVAKIVSIRLGIDKRKILPTSRISEDLGGDSFAAIEIEVIIEQKFGVSFEDEEWVEIKTFGRLISAIYGKKNKN
jgi:acyl carrier protein